MTNNWYEIIKGADILTLSDEKEEPIVQDFLNKNDYVLIVAEEKVGKTIFAQQLACCLTAGKPFLDILEIPCPVNVWYIATEGKREELKERFVRISSKVGIDVERLRLIPSFFRFNTREGKESLTKLIEENSDLKPEVIIVDALYRALAGELTKAADVNEFHHVIGWFAHQLDAAVILVHHLKKPTRTQEGIYLDRSDKDTYGSAFLMAAVDHVFWLEKSKTDLYERYLKCNTQRSGNIISLVRLKLNQPDPLYFEAMDVHTEEKHKVVTVLRTSARLDISALEDKTTIKRTMLYKVLRELYDKGIVGKSKGKRKFYYLK